MLLLLAIEFLVSGAVIAVADHSNVHSFLVKAINNTELARIFSEVSAVAHRNRIVGAWVIAETRNGLKKL